MKHHRSLLLGLAAVSMAACADTPTSIATEGPEFGMAAVGHLVAGSGHVEMAAGLREFTFHAVERPDGSINGSYKVVLPNGLFFEADVTCLSVDGNAGWIGGVIRATHAGIVVVGSTSMFYAIDNGEGGSEPDVVSVAVFNGAEGADIGFCEEQPIELAPLTVTDGNVQVR
jgi:hypothetical protein